MQNKEVKDSILEFLKKNMTIKINEFIKDAKLETKKAKKEHTKTLIGGIEA